MSEYSFKKKKRLMQKIEKITKEKYLLKIMDIIKEDPSCVNSTEQNDGVFLYFHNLETVTYDKIDNYIKDLKKNKKISRKVESDIISDYTPYSVQDGLNLNAKLRLNNQEKSVIKRKQYEKEISNDKYIYDEFDISKYTDTDNVSISPVHTKKRGRKKKTKDTKSDETKK